MADQGVSQSRGRHTAAPSPSNESGLDLVGLTKVFPGGTVAVDDVNLHVDHGEYVVLLGPSGCGKTTTLRMIGGHEYPTEGDILLDGQSLDRPAAAQAARRRPSSSTSRSSRTGRRSQNVEFGLKMHGVGKEERREAGVRGARDGRPRRRSPTASRARSRAGSSSASPSPACS